MGERELVQMALQARAHAYAPYSGFSVGAALQCTDGTIFTGCNVENAAYGSSLCAERGALMKAVSEGKRQFRRIAVAGSGSDICSPCGACRQMLYEFAPDLNVLISNCDGDFTRTFLSDLLPHGFGPEKLQGGKYNPVFYLVFVFFP